MTSLLLKRWVSRSRFDREAAARQEVQDRVRLLESQVFDLRAERDAALRDASDSRAMVADWLAEQMFGKRIYNSSAPALPAHPVAYDQMPQSQRISARQLVRDAEAKFFKDYDALQASDDLKLSATS